MLFRSLRPGVPGLSDNIRVISIIGRFLEHSRIYWFLNGGADQMFIGSADLMERNLDRRVEVLTPVRDRAILAHVRDVVLQACLEDTDRARMLTRDGGYVRVERRSSTPSAQDALIAHYEAADTDRR